MSEEKIQTDSKTNTQDFFSELGAGAFEPKLAFTLSEAALNACLYGNGKRASKVTLTFTIKQLGDNDQVVISHKIAKEVPTARGKKAEEDVTETSFFVGKGGVLSMAPPREDNSGQFSLSRVQ